LSTRLATNTSLGRGAATSRPIFLDSTGRAYTLNRRNAALGARPGRAGDRPLDLPDGASIVSLLAGEARIATAGRFRRLRLHRQARRTSQGRNKAGKACLTLDGTPLLPPATVKPDDRVAVATAEGRLLVFPIGELPELAKGKGNKLIGLKGEDRIVAACLLPAGSALEVTSLKRRLTIKASDLEASYLGARASRGNPLPRGYQRVDAMAAVASGRTGETGA
jgi:topoisomerase IV subunit A